MDAIRALDFVIRHFEQAHLTDDAGDYEEAFATLKLLRDHLASLLLVLDPTSTVLTDHGHDAR